MFREGEETTSNESLVRIGGIHLPSVAEKVGLRKEELICRIRDFDADIIREVADFRSLKYDKDLSIEKLRLMVIFDIIGSVVDFHSALSRHKIFEGEDKTYFMGDDYLWRFDEHFIDVQIIGEYDNVGVLSLFMHGKDILGTHKGRVIQYEVEFDYKAGLLYSETYGIFLQGVNGTEKERNWLKMRTLLE